MTDLDKYYNPQIDFDNTVTAIKDAIQTGASEVVAVLNGQSFEVIDIIDCDDLFTVVVKGKYTEQLQSLILTCNVDVSTAQLYRGYRYILDKTNDRDFNVPLHWFEFIVLERRF